MLHALVVDDDAHSLSALAELVQAEGFDTARADNLAQARAALENQMPDVVLSDLMLPDGRGTELLKELLEEPTVEVILITGKATVETAVEALRLGAFDYLTKPIDLGRLKTLLARVKETRELKQAVSSLRAELRDLGRFGPMVGTAPAMQRVYDLIDKVAPTEATAFLVGESGTGKELAAETIHQLSKRRKGPYLPLNCGAISPTLIESELFGHEKGSFTGALARRPGRFELADGGTLFLDEIGDLPLALQAKILRALEERRFERVGGTASVQVDVRLVAATNRGLRAAVAQRRFREDLFFRLSVFPITVPPLRDRAGDIPMLTGFFIERFCRDMKKKPLALSPEAVDVLTTYRWPGNVRELQNCIERAVILTEGDDIQPRHLNLSFVSLERDPEPPNPLAELSFDGSLNDVTRRAVSVVEKMKIEQTLKEADGSKGRAAELLQISYKMFLMKLKEHRLE